MFTWPSSLYLLYVFKSVSPFKNTKSLDSGPNLIQHELIVNDSLQRSYFQIRSHSKGFENFTIFLWGHNSTHHFLITAFYYTMILYSCTYSGNIYLWHALQKSRQTSQIKMQFVILITVNVFGTGPETKYFRLCALYILCSNYLTVLLECESRYRQYINIYRVGSVPI